MGSTGNTLNVNLPFFNMCTFPLAEVPDCFCTTSNPALLSIDLHFG